MYLKNVFENDIFVKNPDNYLSHDEMYFGTKIDAFLKKKSKIKIEKRNFLDFKLITLTFYCT